MSRTLQHALLVVTSIVALAACTTVAAPAPAVVDGAPFALTPGEQVQVAGGGTLRYLRLVNDSRCPPDVQCIWAGDAEIALKWQPVAAPARALSLHTHLEPKTADLDGHRLRLLSLARGTAPQAQLQLDATP